MCGQWQNGDPSPSQTDCTARARTDILEFPTADHSNINSLLRSLSVTLTPPEHKIRFPRSCPASLSNFISHSSLLQQFHCTCPLVSHDLPLLTLCFGPVLLSCITPHTVLSPGSLHDTPVGVTYPSSGLGALQIIAYGPSLPAACFFVGMN